MPNRLSNSKSLIIFAEEIQSWYSDAKRVLPWRDTKEPYFVWLSEIILQQTRVAQGTPYYLRFVEKYPNVGALAKAGIDEVLRLWQGLGYYSRARNLHACAKTVSNELGGEFPTTASELEKLKGIGKYTAAAIASICYDEPVPVIDGNVYRVLSRVFNIKSNTSKPQAYREFYDLSLRIIPKMDPGDYNQAVMEFGALHCTPKNPSCEKCVLNNICESYQLGIVSQRPVKSKKEPVKDRYFNYVLFVHENEVLIRKRREKDIWQELYEFHNIVGDLGVEGMLARLQEEIGSQYTNHLVLEEQSASVKHLLTHQRLFVKFYTLKVSKKEVFLDLAKTTKMRAVAFERLESYGKPILIENFLKKRTLSLF